MSPDQHLVENWLNQNQTGLITCPYQPGGLVISKRACMKRFQTAQPDTLPWKTDDLFRHTLRRGLSLCRGCPIGKRLALTRETNLEPNRVEAMG